MLGASFHPGLRGIGAAVLCARARSFFTPAVAVALKCRSHRYPEARSASRHLLVSAAIPSSVWLGGRAPSPQAARGAALIEHLRIAPWRASAGEASGPQHLRAAAAWGPSTASLLPLLMRTHSANGRSVPSPATAARLQPPCPHLLAQGRQAGEEGTQEAALGIRGWLEVGVDGRRVPARRRGRRVRGPGGPGQSHHHRRLHQGAAGCSAADLA